MAEAKHTPGPWSVEDVTSGYDHDICLGYKVPNAGHPTLLATVFFDQDNDGPISASQANANARLIAAAPSLLAACKESIRLLTAYGDPFNGDDWQAVQDIRAAVALAEGTNG
jgi:hypothetical protein